MSNRRSVDSESQLVTTESVVEESRGKTTAVPLTLHYLFRYETEHLFELCWFETEALYGDCNRDPYHYGGEQIWMAGKGRVR